MALLTLIDSSTLTNRNLSVAATPIHTFTNTTHVRLIFLRLFADQVTGNGDYTVWITVQRGGVGSSYSTVQTIETLPSGETSHVFNSLSLVVNATDVVKVYLLGLAGDTTTPDIITEVFEEFINVDSSGNLDVTVFPSGAIEVTFTVENSDTSLPIEGARVWITTDLAGTNVVWSGSTDAFGISLNVMNEKPFLNAGTYYAWVQDSGYTDSNPTVLAVS